RRRDGGQLPPRRQPGGDRTLRARLPRGRGVVRQLHPRVHRLRRPVGRRVRAPLHPDRGRRRQVAAGGDHRASHAGEAVRRSRRRARPDLPAEHRRQHGLPQHAEPRAHRRQAALEDRGGAERAPQPAAPHPHPHRAERLRPLAARQQGLLPAHGGTRLRQRAHRARAAALGRGQPQLRRLRDRRHPLLPRGAGSEDRRPPPERGGVPDEAPSAPAHRRSRQGAGRGLPARGGRALVWCPRGGWSRERRAGSRGGRAQRRPTRRSLSYAAGGRSEHARRRLARIPLAGAAPGPAAPLVGPRVRAWYRGLLAPLADVLVGARVHPDAVTWAQLAVSMLAGAAFWAGWLFVGGWLTIVAGTLDALDGGVARQAGVASPRGALVDSLVDRCAEFATFLGLGAFFRDSWVLLALAVACFGSFMVSYTRARAEALGVDVQLGSAQRP